MVLILINIQSSQLKISGRKIESDIFRLCPTWLPRIFLLSCRWASRRFKQSLEKAVCRVGWQQNRKDEVVAMESWIAYTQRNQSIIVDLLTGQYKSKWSAPSAKYNQLLLTPLQLCPCLSLRNQQFLKWNSMSFLKTMKNKRYEWVFNTQSPT